MDFQSQHPDATSQIIPGINDPADATITEIDPANSNIETHPNTPTGNEPVENTNEFEDEAVGDVSARSSVLSTATVSSSVCNFPSENGRTYHALNNGKYLLPNDEKEQDRLDLQHHLFILTFGLYLAPINTSPQSVLDIGTGTGIWAIEFADMHPSAAVIGVDLSPIQPKWVPANLKFIVDDVEEVWKYSKKFDFIHGRMLCTCFERPEQVIQSAFENLKPGGYLELQDAVLPLQCDDESLNGTHLARWIELLLEGAKKLERDWTCASKYKTYMIEAGFTDVQEVTTRWPINWWPEDRKQKDLGMWSHTNLVDGIEGFSMRTLTESGLKTREEVEVLLIGVRCDLGDRNIHAYMNVVYGQKPLSREE